MFSADLQKLKGLHYICSETFEILEANWNSVITKIVIDDSSSRITWPMMFFCIYRSIWLLQPDTTNDVISLHVIFGYQIGIFAKQVQQ